MCSQGEKTKARRGSELTSAGARATPGSAQCLHEGSPHLVAQPGESPLGERQGWAFHATFRVEIQLRERRAGGGGRAERGG